MQVGQRGSQDIVGGTHCGENQPRGSKANGGSDESDHRTDQKRHPDGFPKGVLFFCAEILGDRDRRAPGKAYEEHDENIQQRSRRTADCRQSLFSGDPANDQGVSSIVELLEKRAQKQREKEKENLFPDDSLCDGI